MIFLQIDLQVKQRRIINKNLKIKQIFSSFGFRSDGILFNNKVELEKFEKKIKNGDIIGCGLNFVKNEIFFVRCFLCPFSIFV